MDHAQEENRNFELFCTSFDMRLTFLKSILQKDFDLFLVSIGIYVLWLVLNGLLPKGSSPKEYFTFSKELT